MKKITIISIGIILLVLKIFAQDEEYPGDIDPYQIDDTPTPTPTIEYQEIEEEYEG